MTIPQAEVPNRATCVTHHQRELVLVTEGPASYFFCPTCESDKALAFIRHCRDPWLKEAMRDAFMRAPRYRAEGT